MMALFAGWEKVSASSAEGSVRRGGVRGTRVTANGANITRFTAKRDNFDGCPTCAGEERRATGQQRLDSLEARPACPESSSQLQSASHTPIKDSQTQTSPSCIKHFIQLFSLHHAF